MSFKYGQNLQENGEYAPFSLLRALNDRDTNHYWFDSGTTRGLVEHLKRYSAFNPLDFDGTELSLDAFNAPCEKARTPIPLLYQSGYLTIQSYDKKLDTFTLHFPNHEVRQGMIRSMTSYLMDADSLECDTTIVSMTRALLNGDLSTALTALRSYIAGLPYDIITQKKPKDFQLALPSWRQHPHSPSPSRAPLPCDRAGGKIHSAA